MSGQEEGGLEVVHKADLHTLALEGAQGRPVGVHARAHAAQACVVLGQHQGALHGQRPGRRLAQHMLVGSGPDETSTSAGSLTTAACAARVARQLSVQQACAHQDAVL